MVNLCVLTLSFSQEIRVLFLNNLKATKAVIVAVQNLLNNDDTGFYRTIYLG